MFFQKLTFIQSRVLHLGTFDLTRGIAPPDYAKVDELHALLKNGVHELVGSLSLSGRPPLPVLAALPEREVEDGLPPFSIESPVQTD